jgi:hypothetical protein
MSQSSAQRIRFSSGLAYSRHPSESCRALTADLGVSHHFLISFIPFTFIGSIPIIYR